MPGKTHTQGHFFAVLLMFVCVSILFAIIGAQKTYGASAGGFDISAQCADPSLCASPKKYSEKYTAKCEKPKPGEEATKRGVVGAPCFVLDPFTGVKCYGTCAIDQPRCEKGTHCNQKPVVDPEKLKEELFGGKGNEPDPGFEQGQQPPQNPPQQGQLGDIPPPGNQGPQTGVEPDFSKYGEWGSQPSPGSTPSPSPSPSGFGPPGGLKPPSGPPSGGGGTGPGGGGSPNFPAPSTFGNQGGGGGGKGPGNALGKLGNAIKNTVPNMNDIKDALDELKDWLKDLMDSLKGGQAPAPAPTPTPQIKDKAGAGETKPQPTPATEKGIASTYWQPQRTAEGGQFDPNAMTAAHKTLPLGTRVRVCNGSKCVVVRINDRGPYVKGRIIDLSDAAGKAIGINRTTAPVTVDVVPSNTPLGPVGGSPPYSPPVVTDPGPTGIVGSDYVQGGAAPEIAPGNVIGDFEPTLTNPGPLNVEYADFPADATDVPQSVTSNDTATYEGNDAAEQPASYEGNDAEEQPASYEGNGAEEQPASYEGDDAAEQPAPPGSVNLADIDWDSWLDSDLWEWSSDSLLDQSVLEGNDAAEQPASYEGNDAAEQPAPPTNFEYPDFPTDATEIPVTPEPDMPGYFEYDSPWMQNLGFDSILDPESSVLAPPQDDTNNWYWEDSDILEPTPPDTYLEPDVDLTAQEQPGDMFGDSAPERDQGLEQLDQNVGQQRIDENGKIIPPGSNFDLQEELAKLDDVQKFNALEALEKNADEAFQEYREALNERNAVRNAGEFDQALEDKAKSAADTYNNAAKDFRDLSTELENDEQYQAWLDERAIISVFEDNNMEAAQMSDDKTDLPQDASEWDKFYKDWTELGQQEAAEWNKSIEKAFASPGEPTFSAEQAEEERQGELQRAGDELKRQSDAWITEKRQEFKDATDELRNWAKEDWDKNYKDVTPGKTTPPGATPPAASTKTPPAAGPPKPGKPPPAGPPPSAPPPSAPPPGGGGAPPGGGGDSSMFGKLMELLKGLFGGGGESGGGSGSGGGQPGSNPSTPSGPGIITPPPTQPKGNAPKPVAIMIVNPDKVQPGKDARVSWSSIHTDDCDVTDSNGNTVSSNLTDGTALIKNLTNDITVTISCSVGGQVVLEKERFVDVIGVGGSQAQTKAKTQTAPETVTDIPLQSGQKEACHPSWRFDKWLACVLRD